MDKDKHTETNFHKLVLIVMEVAIFIGFLYWYFIPE